MTFERSIVAVKSSFFNVYQLLLVLNRIISYNQTKSNQTSSCSYPSPIRSVVLPSERRSVGKIMWCCRKQS